MGVVCAGGRGSEAAIGARDHLKALVPKGRVTVVANTADDHSVYGLRVCPDLDALMYALGGASDPFQPLDTSHRTHATAEALTRYGARPAWFAPSDLEMAAYVVRSQMLDAGEPLHRIERALSDRWEVGVDLLPMTDDMVATRVVVDGSDAPRDMSLQDWLADEVRELVPRRFHVTGTESAIAAPGVGEAIAHADAVLIAPSNPILTIGPILAVPGVREALESAGCAVVGVSPIIGSAAAAGIAADCLRAIGVEVTAPAVAKHLGARSRPEAPQVCWTAGSWTPRTTLTVRTSSRPGSEPSVSPR